MGVPPDGAGGADEQHLRAESEDVELAPDPGSGGDDAGKKR